MKIEDLIAQIQKHKNPKKGSIPAAVTADMMALVSRLEGMLPDVEKARTVATALGITWGTEPGDAVLAWAWTAWPLIDASRLGELLPVVLPLLPEGQPFGQSEIDAVRGDALLAEVGGDKAALDNARAKGQAMREHNQRRQVPVRTHEYDSTRWP